MNENFVPQEAGRTAENKLEEVNEKIAFAKKLIEIGAIAPDEDIPEEAFSRVSELAALPYFHSSEAVQKLAAIEYLFSRLSGTSELAEAAHDVKEYLDDIVQALGSDEFANVDEDTLEVVRNLAIAKVAAGERLTDALIAAVAERKEVLRATPDLTGYVDSQDSVVNLENPRQ